MKFGTFRRAAVVLAVSLSSALSPISGAIAAQEPPPAASGGAAPSGQLDIPQAVNFVGRQEPNVARATAIVNEEIITRSDIDQRIALIAASNRVEIPPNELERLRQQVLRNLIDETLQIQAAREREVTVEQRDIDQYYGRFAQGFQRTPQAMGEYLRTIGSSERSVKRQIQGELSWQRLQRRIIRVSVPDQEVEEVLARLNASRGSAEFRVAEIFISATPERAAAVRGQLTQIVQQLRGGASFAAYARQYSEASSAAAGGNLGWLRSEQLPVELGAMVQSMPIGGISDPIQVSSGFSVVALQDRRQVLMADPRDATLSLMQMSIPLPAGATEASARPFAERLSTTSQGMGGCGRAAEAARTIGAELVSNDNVRVRELPAALQQMLLGMSVGQATAPFGSLERISVLVLCGRDDPQPVGAPTREAIVNQLEEERMNRQAQRFLRDLRRDAVVEYR